MWRPSRRARSTARTTACSRETCAIGSASMHRLSSLLQRIDLSAIDLVQNGKPLSTFSVAALQRLQRDATVSSNGFTCLLHAGAADPGEDTVAAIFDAMNDTEHLHSEDIRSLSDVFRSTAESVAPAVRIPPPEALLATSDCNRDCMARRIGATFVITGTVRNQEGELLYSVRASNVPSGTVIATATASGKTLGELAAAVRKLAARLFGCRE